MTSVPAWAMSHLEKHLPAGNPVVNAQAVRRNLILANTRLGAVLVTRGFWSGTRHVFLEVPSQKTAFQCTECSENLQFYNLDIPADVFCSICAAKYHVDEKGQVTGAEGTTLRSEFKPKQLHPFPPVWEMSDRMAQREAPADESATESPRRRSARKGAAYRHNGYTLYARETATKGGAHTLYFFSKGKPKSGRPSSLPDGYAVGANSRTGLPFLKKGSTPPPADEEMPPKVATKVRRGRRRKASRRKA